MHECWQGLTDSNLTMRPKAKPRAQVQALEGALRKKKAVVLARAEAERQAPDQAPGGRSLLQRWVASVLQPGGGAQAAGARIQALQDEVCVHMPAIAQSNKPELLPPVPRNWRTQRP